MIEKFSPKLIHIAYAHMISADDDIDTEKGQLNWYSDEAMENFNYDYNALDDEKEQYETSIECKFGTNWGKKHMLRNPDFVSVIS